MDINVIVQAVLALGTIIGGGVAAYATYRSTNSAVKIQEKQIGLEEKRVSKELGTFGIEEAERISNISLANLQFMQQLVNECGIERATLRTENNRLTLEVTLRQVRSMQRLARLKEIREKLNRIDVPEDAPWFTVITEIKELIVQLILEMEENN